MTAIARNLNGRFVYSVGMTVRETRFMASKMRTQGVECRLSVLLTGTKKPGTDEAFLAGVWSGRPLAELRKFWNATFGKSCPGQGDSIRAAFVKEGCQWELPPVCVAWFRSSYVPGYRAGD